ncbi:hypothetical protein R1sor_001767 [Riccia sorocarpa]|uniref:Uncharacterized protein n=1 Tax=Riccia sorocarpa TaxID=122646 RepID=A0ABD3GWV3_9MARC
MSMAAVLQLPLSAVPSSSSLQMKSTRRWRTSPTCRTLSGKSTSSPMCLHFGSSKKASPHVGIVLVTRSSASCEGVAETEHFKMLTIDSENTLSCSVSPRETEKKSFLAKLIRNLQLFGVLVALGMVLYVKVASAIVDGKKKELFTSTRPVSAFAVTASDRPDQKGGELTAAYTPEAEEAGYQRTADDAVFLDSEVDREAEKVQPSRILSDVKVASIVTLDFHDSILYTMIGVALAAEIDGSDEEVEREYEDWVATPYAITVPLRLVGLRGSVPPSWLKDFTRSQGKRVKLVAEFQGSLQSIFTELSTALTRGQQLTPKSALAADLVTVGDSWLDKAVSRGLITPIENVEKYEWFQRLGKKWQAFLRRNKSGDVDPDGKVYAVPYRWGSVMIAYNKKKLKQHGIPPIEDWEDLWRPELAGKISMISSPRDVIGATLKSLGASYNVRDFETDVPGGREAVKDKFTKLQRQVRLFDSVQYLKTLGAGEVWVAVGWSGDVIPFGKRTSNISVVTPRSGTSLWADLWAIPATPERSTKVGGRIRGPSPLVPQWLDFCLQFARANSFKDDVIVGASPLALAESSTTEASSAGSASSGQEIGVEKAQFVPTDLPKNSHEVLRKNEFLEPLSPRALEDFKWLLSTSSELSRTNSVAKKFQNIFSSRTARDSQSTL